MPTVYTTDIPKKWNMKLYKGNKWPEQPWQFDDENGNPIIDYTARMQVRRNSLSAVVVEFSDGDGLLVDGRKRTIDADVDLDAGSYVYDFEVTINGEVYTPLAGTIQVTQDTTYGS